MVPRCPGAFSKLCRLRNLEDRVALGLDKAVDHLIVAAAEAAVGLALIISVYRNMNSVDPEKLDQMKL